MTHAHEVDPPCTCCQDTGYDDNRERFCDCAKGIDAKFNDLIERLLNAQQDINLAANSTMDQSLCDASAIISEVEIELTRLRKELDEEIALRVGALDRMRAAEADRDGWRDRFQAEARARVELQDALVRSTEPFPQPRRKDGEEPCGECHIQPGETCDICGAVNPAQEGADHGRPIGEPHQEVGGVMVTLAALCLANALSMGDAAETELARIWTKVDAIRAKQAAKPMHSPLPGPSAQPKDDQRKTFEIPEGYEAVVDADGRSTGAVRPITRKQSVGENRP